jgi:hypothetical protein
MPRVQVLVQKFNAGELSPRMEGFVGFDRYPSGFRVLENMLPLPQGPVTRRPGSRYVNLVKTEPNRTALIEFEFSTVQAYMIEVGHQYFRFYKDLGVIESPPGVPVEVATPYATADLFDGANRKRLRHAQSADVLYLFHGSFCPRKLSRSSHTSWSLATIAFTDGPYLDQNADAAKTLVASAASGSVTVTAAGHAPFAATDAPSAANPGRLIRMKNGANWAWLQITAFTSATVVTATVKGATGAPVVATADWMLGLYSDTTGWPALGALHEERLFLAANAHRPQRFDASKVNDFENFTPGVADDDPLAFNMASDQVNAIRWLASSRDLLCGTTGAEGRIGTDTLDAPLTPTNTTVRWQTRHGAADMHPVLADNAVLFVQRQGKKLRELAYSIEADGYRAPDMTLLAEHISGGGLIDLAYQQEPWSTIWAARADGMLLSFTYQRDEKVVAWARHPLGGAGAQVEALASIPGAGSDQLWMIVKRVFNGATSRTIEVIQAPLGDDEDQANAFYVDCGLPYSGAPAATLTGLGHLEGQSVAILGDGAVFPRQAVAGGSVTLDSAVSKAAAGLPYAWKAKPMRLEAGAAAGTAQAQMKRIDTLWLRLHRSVSIRAGRDEDHLRELPFRDGSMPLGEAVPLFTGDKKVTFSGDWSPDDAIVLTHDDPTPVTLVALIARLAVNEG